MHLRVAIKLRKNDAVTPSELRRLVEMAYSPGFPVKVTHLDRTANIRDLLLSCGMYAVPHVTRPQAFRVARDPNDGVVKMQVQFRSYTEKWGTIDR